MTKCIQCEYLSTCVARLIDEAITGCDMEDYVANVKSLDELQIEKTFTNYVNVI